MLVAACSVFTSLEGLDDGSSGDVVRVGSDSSSIPDVFVDANEEDVSLPDDAGDASSPDPCVDPRPLLGRSDLASLVADPVPDGALDAYPFSVLEDGVAGCFWVFLDQAPLGGVVRAGIYTHNQTTTAPLNLLRFVELSDVIAPAWNKVALAEKIALKAGTPYWLAVAPQRVEPDAGTAVMRLRIRTSGCPPTLMLTAGAIDPMGSLPSVFSVSTTYPGECEAALYLGR